MTERRPDPFDLVGRHRHPNARTAHQNCPLDPGLHHGLGDHVGYVGIVNRMAVVCSEINALMAQLSECADYPLLGGKAAMVTSKTDSHGSLQTVFICPPLVESLYCLPNGYGIVSIPGIWQAASRYVRR